MATHTLQVRPNVDPTPSLNLDPRAGDLWNRLDRLVVAGDTVTVHSGGIGPPSSRTTRFS
jgi:hypothetical protein